MIGEGLFLQIGGFYGGSFGNFLLQLDQLGFFTFILPFLIIFAMIFGVLSRVQMFGDNKTIYVILSLAVSLMAIQFGFVSQFFSDIFPIMGIWLSVILVIFIIMGLFNPTGKWNKLVMFVVGLTILTIILVQSFGLNWYTGYWLPYNWGPILAILLVLVGVGAIIANTPKSSESPMWDLLKNATKGVKFK